MSVGISHSLNHLLNNNQHQKSLVKDMKLLPLRRFQLYNELDCNINTKTDDKLLKIKDLYHNDNYDSPIATKVMATESNMQQYFLCNSYNKNFFKYFPQKENSLLRQSNSVIQTIPTITKSPNNKPIVLFPSISNNCIDQSLNHLNTKLSPSQKVMLNKNNINFPIFNNNTMKTIDDLDRSTHNESVVCNNINNNNNNRNINNKIKLEIKDFKNITHKKKPKLYYPKQFHALNAYYSQNRKEIKGTYTEINELDSKLNNEYSCLRKTCIKMDFTED